MEKRLILAFALAVAIPLAGQTRPSAPLLLSEHPAVQASVEKFVSDQSLSARGKGSGPRYASGNALGGGYAFGVPPVALKLNRVQFDDRDTLQASLVVLQNRALQMPVSPLPAEPVHLSLITTHLESGATRVAYAGTQMLIPGQTIPLQTYVFEGSETPGVYAYVVMMHGENSGQLLMMPGTHFIFRMFNHSDTARYLRLDSTDFSEADPRFLTVRGNLARTELTGLSQAALINGRLFPITQSDGRTAVIDLGFLGAIPAGVHDITLLAYRDGNTAFDSNTVPAAVRIFLPAP
jgi:hypothetical protein